MRLLGITFALVLTSCASNHKKFTGLYSETDILERAFGEFERYEGITFLAGPLHSPGSQYGLHATEEGAAVAHTSDDGFHAHFVESADCPELKISVRALEVAVWESIKIAAGESPPRKWEYLVLDGPIYSLKLNSDVMSGDVILEGGAMTRQVVPWINAAYEVGEVVDACLGS